jgi:RNA polymerase sigma-70 factor (ECF subfamily)
MNEQSVQIGTFAEVVLPHLDSAYNLARWLVRSGDDAEDIAQEAMMRAFQYFDGFHGGDARAWLLRIVRNASYGWLQKNRARQPDVFDEAIHAGLDVINPETLMLQNADARLVEAAMNALPARLREVLVLRELEGLTYKEISAVIGLPMGTVMSSLSRARARFRHAVNEELSRDPVPPRIESRFTQRR